MEAGNLFAVLDASQFAEDSGVEPKWLQTVKDHIFRKTILAEAHGGQWQKNSNKCRRAIKHFDRWEAVYIARMRGTSWSDAFDEASKLLKKTTARGSADAIEASFKKVNKERKDPKKRFLYYRISATTRVMAGIPFYKSTCS
jgi:hypothetical protein